MKNIIFLLLALVTFVLIVIRSPISIHQMATDRATTEPIAANRVTTDPVAVKSVAAESDTIDQVTTDRATTDQATTDQVTTDQVTTDRLQLLIPLYIYPSHYDATTYAWSEVATAQGQIPITAVINPNSGPNNGPPNADYAKGLDDLRAANVTLLGYISTRYGDRNLDEVKAEIDLYDTYYNIAGIFLDEAASQANKVSYYQTVYDYIRTKPALTQVILNQGTHPDESYLRSPTANTLIVFENYASAWGANPPLAYANQYSADRFAVLVHSAPSVEDMQRSIDLAVDRNIKYVYVTDDSPDNLDQNPWNQLPSYWAEEVAYIRNINQTSHQTANSVSDQVSADRIGNRK